MMYLFPMKMSEFTHSIVIRSENREVTSPTNILNNTQTKANNDSNRLRPALDEYLGTSSDPKTKIC